MEPQVVGPVGVVLPTEVDALGNELAEGERTYRGDLRVVRRSFLPICIPDTEFERPCESKRIVGLEGSGERRPLWMLMDSDPAVESDPGELPAVVDESREYAWDETLLPDGKHTDEVPWAEWYASCPVYGEIWTAVLRGTDWPVGYELATVRNKK